jgi:hypothetical protein
MGNSCLIGSRSEISSFCIESLNHPFGCTVLVLRVWWGGFVGDSFLS